MSLTCPHCGSAEIITERRPDGNNTCLKCQTMWLNKTAGPCTCGGDNLDLENRFTYHSPKEGQPARYEILRNKAKELSYLIVELCPDSREKALALTNLEQAIFWANASIARHE